MKKVYEFLFLREKRKDEHKLKSTFPSYFLLRTKKMIRDAISVYISMILVDVFFYCFHQQTSFCFSHIAVKTSDIMK